MSKIRWGIVGPGIIAEKFAKAIKNVERAELCAVASRSEEKGKEFAQKHGIDNVFCGYEKMAESDIVDAVYISTPHPFHKPCAELFLKAKKHVLCEKPICVNEKEAVKLKEISAENNVFLMEAMWTRFLPAIEKIVNVANSGQIGDVLGLEADFCYYSTPQEEAKLFENNMAGGSLLDVGVYALHFSSLLFGNKPEKIVAMSNVSDGVDLHTNILLKYESGAISNLSSAIALEKPDSAYIYGTKGIVFIPHFYGAEEFTVTCGKNSEHYKIPCIGDGFEEEIYEVCKCISDGKIESDVLPLDESITILKQMDEIRKQIGLVYPFD